MRIAVVDYGMGNLRSVAKALAHVAPQADVQVSADAAVLRTADRVVVPGQGAMPDCMRQLAARGLREAVLAAARTKPFLGVCIGLQMLFDWSEEGGVAGLGLFSGRVRRFPASGANGGRLKVPHMGWNEVWPQASHPLWDGVAPGARFYFVHSYYAQPGDARLCAARTDYGLAFTSAAARDNIFAVQFHPEKSQAAGLRLLSNFVRWNP